VVAVRAVVAVRLLWREEVSLSSDDPLPRASAFNASATSSSVLSSASSSSSHLGFCGSG